MENIDMEAIARWSRIHEYYGCDNCTWNNKYHLDSCCQCSERPLIVPNFRDPEWLVRLEERLWENGYTVCCAPGLVIIYKDYKSCEGRHDNRTDAFLLAVTKLAKEA